MVPLTIACQKKNSTGKASRKALAACWAACRVRKHASIAQMMGFHRRKQGGVKLCAVWVNLSKISAKVAPFVNVNTNEFHNLGKFSSFSATLKRDETGDDVRRWPAFWGKLKHVHVCFSGDSVLCSFHQLHSRTRVLVFTHADNEVDRRVFCNHDRQKELKILANWEHPFLPPPK